MFDSIKGLLGGKKSQGEASAPKTKKSKGYFLELDDTGNVKSETGAKSPEPKKAKAEEPATPAQPAKAAVAKSTTPKAEPVKEVPSGKETVKIQAQPNPPAVAATNGRVEAQGESTFAPKYLMPTPTNSRRRPGPSMNMFRDMARQVKTPIK